MELSAIDRHFADFLSREGGSASPLLRVVAALVSRAVGCGNICLDLEEIAEREIEVDGEGIRVPGIAAVRRSLAESGVVGVPGDFRPLVLDNGNRIYLYRYWQYERDLARILLEKGGTPGDEIDEPLLREGIGRLFPGNAGPGTDWQKVATLAAVRKRFCVISGGPGTGKTSTVVKIIALLLEQARGELPRIALAAPTGKSAARLRESIHAMKENLSCSAAVRAGIPEDVSTIHRLLGVVRGSVRFRHGTGNRLPHDVVIVDEASMVALPLMAKLAAALPDRARLILLGDRDQLASVEAGAVLGDICGSGRSEQFSAEFSAFVARMTGDEVPADRHGEAMGPLSDSLVILKKNYRFGADSGIGSVGNAVNAGEGKEALKLLVGEEFSDVAWRNVPKPEGLGKALAGAVAAGYGAYLGAGSPEEALRSFDSFRVLCAVRQGPHGVAGLNALVEGVLAGKGLIDPRQRWYHGRPVMVTVNDYNLGLFNGDVGVVFHDRSADGTPSVCFPSPGGGVRKVPPVRLPPHETVYAMTVHKSQGSEFDRLLLVLPPHDSAPLTRELIYTGITRAKKGVELWGTEDVFLDAVARRIVRTSGLGEALWGDGEPPPR